MIFEVRDVQFRRIQGSEWDGRHDVRPPVAHWLSGQMRRSWWHWAQNHPDRSGRAIDLDTPMIPGVAL
jgi:hypothetical protein